MKSEKVKLESVCKRVVSGGTPKSTVSDYYNGSIPWLNTKEVHFNRIYSTEKTISDDGLKNSSAKWIPSHCVIIAMYGATAGNVAINMLPLTTNQACCNLELDEEKADFRYIYYYLKYKYMDMSLLANGGAQQNLNAKIIKDFPISLPELKVQRKIASMLWSLDDKIALNNKINDNLEQQAQAIFYRYFIDIDKIPDRWSVGCLLDIADYRNGLAMQKYRPAIGEVGLPVLKIKELRQGNCDATSELCSPNINPDYIIHDGDVIFSWSGSLIVDLWCGGTCGLNQHLFKVTSAKYDKWFYYLWTVYYLKHFIAVAADKATTMGHIKREELSKAEVLIPSDRDYREMGAILQPMIALIITNRVENRKLSALRDELLPKLMNGEIEL